MKFTNITYRNTEELYFSYYLDELIEQNIVESYEYEPESFELTPEVTFNYIKTTVLKTKTKIEDKTKALLHKHCYTPDFKIMTLNKGHELNLFNIFLDSFPIFICSQKKSNGENDLDFPCWVDIKGQFAGKTNSTQYTFPLNQKWMYDKYSIYVQKIKPFDLFKATFTPKKVIEEMVYKRDYIKKGKLLAKQGDNRLGYEPITLETWMKKL